MSGARYTTLAVGCSILATIVTSTPTNAQTAGGGTYEGPAAFTGFEITHHIAPEVPGWPREPYDCPFNYEFAGSVSIVLSSSSGSFEVRASGVGERIPGWQYPLPWRHDVSCPATRPLTVADEGLLIVHEADAFGIRKVTNGALDASATSCASMTRSPCFYAEWHPSNTLRNIQYFAADRSQVPGEWSHSFRVAQLAPSAPALDLTILDIAPVQVVLGASELVQGKPTAVFVKVGTNGSYPLTDVRVRVTFGDRVETASIPASAFQPAGFAIATVNPTNRLRPQGPGPIAIFATVDPPDAANPEGLIPESNEQNNTSDWAPDPAVPVTTKANLTVGFVPVSGCEGRFCYNAPSLVSQTAAGGTRYVSALFPAASVTATTPSGVEFWGSQRVIGPAPDAIDRDLTGLDMLALRTHVKRLIGVVNAGYPPYHGRPETRGWARPGQRGMLVQELMLTAVPHELIHSFGLHGHDEDTTSGYWVDGPDAGRLVEGVSNLFAERSATTSPLDALGYWIGKPAFEHLLSQLRPGVDPKVILVSAYLKRDGTVITDRWYFDDDGEVPPASEQPESDYAVQVLDTRGNVLSRTPFVPVFFRYAESDVVEQTDWAPVVLPVPYPMAASSIRLVKGEITLLEVTPASKLLHDAVASLPDAAFVDRPAELRGALLNQVDAIERASRVRTGTGVRNWLSELAGTVDRWLIDDHPVANGLEVTKEELLLLIEELRTRIEA